MSRVLKKENIVSFFEKNCKPLHASLIGIEYETFPFDKKNFSPIAYEGEKGIKALLETIKKEWNWNPVFDSKKIIGLQDPQSQRKISLEPGGQFEFSGNPLSSIHEIEEETKFFIQQLKKIAAHFDIGFLGLGANPIDKIFAIPRMPKSRYKIMADYMPTVNHHGLDMMFRTSTIHANVNFSSEEDMRDKMQVSLKLQPLITGLFANSPLLEGKPNGMETWRYFVWLHTDEQRCRVPPSFFSKTFGFSTYTEWALDIPMYFILRNNLYHKMLPITFREFMQGKNPATFPTAVPTIKDWETHLSTLFPDVRLKKTIEMRGADSGLPHSIFSLSAFWVGILYSKTALQEAKTLLEYWSVQDIAYLRSSIPQKGLDTPFQNRTLRDIAKEILNIAHKGLQERQTIHKHETIFLSPLYEIIETKKNKAKEILCLWEGKWKHSIKKLFAENSF